MRPREVDETDLERLLQVARMYVEAFDDDETMTLPERLQLAEVERILEQYGDGS